MRRSMKTPAKEFSPQENNETEKNLQPQPQQRQSSTEDFQNASNQFLFSTPNSHFGIILNESQALANTMQQQTPITAQAISKYRTTPLHSNPSNMVQPRFFDFGQAIENLKEKNLEESVSSPKIIR